MRDKIVALTTSTSADMVKFKASHLYFDEEKAVGYLSLLMVGYFRSNNFIDLSKFNIVFNICCFIISYLILVVSEPLKKLFR